MPFAVSATMALCGRGRAQSYTGSSSYPSVPNVIRAQTGLAHSKPPGNGFALQAKSRLPSIPVWQQAYPRRTRFQASFVRASLLAILAKVLVVVMDTAYPSGPTVHAANAKMEACRRTPVRNCNGCLGTPSAPSVTPASLHRGPHYLCQGVIGFASLVMLRQISSIARHQVCRTQARLPPGNVQEFLLVTHATDLIVVMDIASNGQAT